MREQQEAGSSEHLGGREREEQDADNAYKSKAVIRKTSLVNYSLAYSFVTLKHLDLWCLGGV